MLKWLKNAEKSSSVDIKGEARPPWIQKIRVPVSDRPEPELQWKSRLAEKLGEMRHVEPAPKPTRVTQLDGYAFHIAPLDIATANLTPETTRQADVPRAPIAEDRPPQRFAIGPAAAQAAYAYTPASPPGKVTQPG